MSRSIPKVRTYRITFKKAGKPIASFEVTAPTKRLAWLNLTLGGEHAWGAAWTESDCAPTIGAIKA
jgi:hypothetical protein